MAKLTCTGEYALSSPLFDALTIHRPAGDIIIRRGTDASGAPTLGGAPLAGPTVAFDALATGATLELPPPPPTSD